MNKNSQFVKGIVVGIIASIFLYMGVMWYNATLNPEYSKNAMVNSKVNEIINILDENYVDGVDVETLREGVYAGVADEVGDRYTSYLSKESYTSFIDSMSGTYAGIGVYVYASAEDHLITISAAISGSPGDEAGLRADDKIIKVDGKAVTGDEIDEAVSMMKGHPGTEVVVTILRNSTNETFDVTLKRKTIDVPTVSHELLDGSIGYIGISTFDNNTAEQFKAALTELNEKGQKALVIDVRNNLGGYLHRVVEICDMLLPESTIVYREDKSGRKVYSYAKPDQLFKGPMAVLVNSASASASEILAGALKDNNVAVLVGETTFGKGLVQKIFKLSDDSALKVTVEKYFTPSGASINGVGIVPDYEVISVEDTSDTVDSDKQLEMALSVLSGQLSGSK